MAHRTVTAFTHALVRAPAASYAQGLTSAQLGSPGLELACAQHRAYCDALERCEVVVTRLDADVQFPDSTFVEDAAVLVAGIAVLARPGAESRRGEVEGIAAALARFYRAFERIVPPGTLDGGDVCEAGEEVFVGLSHRTNPEGAGQLAGMLTARGMRCTTVDVRGSAELLHLKSGLSWLGGDRLVVAPELAAREAFASFNRTVVDPAEAYAANCVAVNGRVLLPAGHPLLAREVERLGFEPVPLAVSEFRKMDGGLSCLSLRFQ